MFPNNGWTDEYAAFLKSPLGQMQEKWLRELRESLLDDAKDAKTMEEAYGLLRKADGVILTIGHLKSKAVVPGTKGSKEA